MLGDECHPIRYAKVFCIVLFIHFFIVAVMLLSYIIFFYELNIYYCATASEMAMCDMGKAICAETQYATWGVLYLYCIIY